MSELAFWMPWIVAFILTFAFALASLVSSVAYWLVRRPLAMAKEIFVLDEAFVMRGLYFALVLCALFSLLIVAPEGHWFGLVLFIVIIIAEVSGLQTVIERALLKVVQWVKTASSTLMLCALLCLLVIGLASHALGLALFFITIIIGASSFQALIERSLQGEPLEIKRHFSRSFFTSLATASLLFVVVRIIAGTLANSKGLFSSPIPFEILRLSNWLYRMATGSSSTPSWMFDFSTAFCGLLAAWLFAPLSISFYRFLFQNIQLRPGIDRPLRDEELVGSVDAIKTRNPYTTGEGRFN